MTSRVDVYKRQTQMCVDHSSMDVSLYGKYDVKRGLRDINGKGVLAGLTQISNVQAVSYTHLAIKKNLSVGNWSGREAFCI